MTVVIGPEVTEMEVFDLAPWTPYVFVVTKVPHNAEAQSESDESRIFFWVPPEDLPTASVSIGGPTNHMVNVKAGEVSLNQHALFSRCFEVNQLGLLREDGGELNEPISFKRAEPAEESLTPPKLPTW